MTDDTSSTPRRAAAITTRDAFEVAVDETDDGDDAVYVNGTAYHDGLNRNAWGLTEQGARTIADSLVGRDLTASHPPLRDDRYDRAVHGGQGAPIGEVIETEVVTADQAMLADGEYTVRYIAEVKDPAYKQKYQSGLLTGDDYGVSVGIYGNPEAAVCSACGDAMTDCDHERFEEVPVDDGDSEASDGDDDPETQIAGPLYDDGQSDHLASVFLPAYDDADASVASTDTDTPTPAGQDAALAHDSSVPQMDALAASYGTADGATDSPPDDGEPTDATPAASTDGAQPGRWRDTVVGVTRTIVNFDS